MQFITGSIIALLAATSAMAAPTPDYSAPTSEVRVALTNDQTGANGNANVPLNGVPTPVKQLYAGTNVVTYNSYGQPQVLVSSTMLTGGLSLLGNTGSCTFFSGSGAPVTTLTQDKTFVKLGNNPNALQIVDWTDFTLSCSAY